MKTKRYFLIPLVLLVGMSMAGCIGVNQNFKQIRYHLMSEMDVEYSKEIEFSIGSAGIMLAGMFVGLAEVDEPIDEILSNISRVQVGVYERTGRGRLQLDFDDIRKLSNILEEQGWKYIVRSVQGDEMAAVFVNADDEEFNRLYVIAVENHEMVLVELHGDLSKVIEIALRDKGLRFHMADNK